MQTFSGILVLLSFAFFGIGVITGGMVLISVSLILFLIGMSLFAFTVDSEERARIKEKAQKEAAETAETIYKQCIQRNITDISSAESQNALMIIASNCGIKDLSQAIKAYNNGKMMNEEEKAKILAANPPKPQISRFEAARNSDKMQYHSDLDIANITGKDKYLTKLSAEYEEISKEYHTLQNSIEACDRLCSSSYSSSNYSYKKKNTVATAAVVGTILGPAAGVAAAQKARDDNIAAAEFADNEARQRERERKQFSDLSQEFTSRLKNVSNQYFKLQKIMEPFESRLVDELNTQTKFNDLAISEVYTKVNDNKNVIVIANISVNKKISLFGKSAIFDGSLLVTVRSNDGLITGVGYYNAPGYNETDLSKVGFAQQESIEVLCIVDNYQNITESTTFTATFEPYHLWYIEK